MLLFLLAAFPLLLYSFQLGEVIEDASFPTALLTRSPEVVKDEEGASSSPVETQPQKSVQDLSLRSVYTPVKNCHTELREKHGEFSPPSFPHSFEGNIWCNWTIWAGSRKHIIVYIKGFRSSESCDVSGDKIFFHGVSSLVENSAIYACWRKEVHVFATYAQGVHVVLLSRLSAHHRKEKFVGKYYIFKHREMKSSPEGVFGPSEILIPELSRSVLASLSESEKEAFLSMWDRVNTNLSASHRTDGATELRKVPANPSVLSVSSVDNRKFPCSPETIKTRGPASWGHLSESATPSEALSYVPYRSSSSLINPSSPTEGLAIPSTSWVAFIMNDPQAGGKSTQLDSLGSAMYLLASSHSVEATREVNDDISSHEVEEVISTDFQSGTPISEGESRDAPGFETASSPSPEQNCIRTETQDEFFLSPSENVQRGQPSHRSDSPGIIVSGDRFMNQWESRAAPMSEENTMMLDTARRRLESSMEIHDFHKTNWDIVAPFHSPRRILTPETRSVYDEAFGTIENILPVATEFITGTDTSLILATEMLAESRKIPWAGQSSHYGDGKANPELPFFFDEATVAPVVSREPEFPLFGQDHDLSLKIEPTLPFPAEEVEPSLPHRSKASFSFAIPDREPISSCVDPVLSPSLVLSYPFPFTEPGRTFYVPDLNSLVLSETTLALSLAVPTRVGCPCSKTAAILQTEAILQTATEPANVLSPSVMLLELATSLTATLNSLANEQTASTFPPVEIISSSGRLTANEVKTASSLSSCCRCASSTLEEEDLSLLTIYSSWSDDSTGAVPMHSISAAHAATELEHLFATAKMASTDQHLLEGKSSNNFVTAPGEEDERALFSDTIKHLDWLSGNERFLSLGRPTANGQFPQNESVTETSLVFVPVTDEEKSVINYAFISRVALTAVSLHAEKQTQAAFPGPLKSVGDTTRPTERPQENWQIQPSVASLKVPGTLVEALPQKKATEPQTPQPPSDAENKIGSQGPWNKIELGFPWLMVYLPVQTCHVTLTGEAGTFSPPTLCNVQTNNWCNWTIWAGPDKHILVYIEGFEGKPDCEENQDKIVFQGGTSSAENKVAYACQNHGTLVFASQAAAAHVVFLSKASSQKHNPQHFKGRYHIFEDNQVLSSEDGDGVPGRPVLKSGGHVGIPPYVIHSRHILDFEKVGKIPSNENSKSVSSKGRWNSASSLEALLGPAVSNYTPVNRKETQVVKPFAEEYRNRNDTVVGNLEKTVVLGLNGLADKEKAIRPSASQDKPRTFRTRAQWAVAGITSVTAGVGNNGNDALQRPTYVKDARRIKFERSGLLTGVTFPQVLLEEQRPPISHLKNIPEEDEDRMILQPWQSHTEISKISKAVEFQHVEMKEAAEGKRMDVQVMTEGNGNSAVVASGAGRSRSLGTDRLSINTPAKPTMKAKPHLTSLARPNVFHLVSSLNVLDSNLLGIATTSHSQVVLPDSVFVFRSDENDSILESQHKPGDVLLEVTFGIEHKGQIPQRQSELEEDLIKSVKMQVQERVKFLSNNVNEIKLKEIKRKERSERKRINDPNLIFTFWLHLVPEGKNISHFVHSQLEGLGGTSTRSGKIQQVSVGDVNECISGIELCGERAICLNGYGTYFCQCKEGYEDRSLNQSGTLCVRVPPSGLRFLYSYMEIFVGAVVFSIAVIVLVISVLCATLKKRRTKDLNVPEAASSNAQPASYLPPVAFDLNNVDTLLTLDPACLKLRAKSPEWAPPLGSSPMEVYRVSMEQSERL